LGGAVVRGHDVFLRWLAEWLRAVLGSVVVTEQWVAQWDRLVNRHGAQVVEHARLDVAYYDHHGRPVFIDCAIHAANTPRLPAAELLRRSSEPGRAAAVGVGKKHPRYPPGRVPGAVLVAFVFELLGRASPEAQAFLRSVAPSEPSERSAFLAAVWWAASTLVQRRHTSALLGASGGGAWPLPRAGSP
jgi:hypothetical protein